MPVRRGNVEWGLVDANWLRPSRASIRRHTEGDVVVLKIAEPSVLPHGVKDALQPVHSERWINGVQDEMPRIGVGDQRVPIWPAVKRQHGDGLDRTGPGLAPIRGAHHLQAEGLLDAVARVFDVDQLVSINERAVRQDKDLAELHVILRIGPDDGPHRFPCTTGIGRAREHRRPAMSKITPVPNGIDEARICGVWRDGRNGEGVPGVCRFHEDGRNTPVQAAIGGFGN